MNKPIVSVCMITYNHEAFIEEAIQGVLSQKTNFEVEFIISNDASSDKTNLIISNLINDTKNITIKYFNHTQNKGMMSNFIFALEECKGKYIALCEGDDYWTDPLKLQKQVDFLEGNSDYNICFHEVDLLIKDKLQENKGITYKRYCEIENFPIDINILLEKGNFIHTASVVFRNIGLNTLPFEFSKSPIGDYLLYIHLIKNGGSIKKLNNVMAVYRIGSGVYSSLDGLTYKKNILIYQSCILSFLENEQQKKIILSKQLDSLNSHFDNLNKKKDYKRIGKNLSFKQLIHLLLIKIKIFVNNFIK